MRILSYGRRNPSFRHHYSIYTVDRPAYCRVVEKVNIFFWKNKTNRIPITFNIGIVRQPPSAHDPQLNNKKINNIYHRFTIIPIRSVIYYRGPTASVTN